MNTGPEALVELLERCCPEDGIHGTAIESLFLMRHSRPTGPQYSVATPSLCVVVQGEKELWMGRKVFRYRAGDYLVVSTALPVTSQVVEATPARPYLALSLTFEPSQILEILRETADAETKRTGPAQAVNVGVVGPTLLEPMIRLARLVDHPEDVLLLAPLVTKEILYRLVQGPHRDSLKQAALGGVAPGVHDAIARVVGHYQDQLRVEELAAVARMSVPSLHRHFREVTAMSPIQFQKQLRLQKARLLLLAGSADATAAAFQVGYESLSQFSREYTRQFGAPPREDIRRLKD